MDTFFLSHWCQEIREREGSGEREKRGKGRTGEGESGRLQTHLNCIHRLHCSFRHSECCVSPLLGLVLFLCLGLSINHQTPRHGRRWAWLRVLGPGSRLVWSGDRDVAGRSVHHKRCTSAERNKQKRHFWNQRLIPVNYIYFSNSPHVARMVMSHRVEHSVVAITNYSST